MVSRRGPRLHWHGPERCEGSFVVSPRKVNNQRDGLVRRRLLLSPPRRLPWRKLGLEGDAGVFGCFSPKVNNRRDEPTRRLLPLSPHGGFRGGSWASRGRRGLWLFLPRSKQPAGRTPSASPSCEPSTAPSGEEGGPRGGRLPHVHARAVCTCRAGSGGCRLAGPAKAPVAVVSGSVAPFGLALD